MEDGREEVLVEDACVTPTATMAPMKAGSTRLCPGERRGEETGGESIVLHANQHKHPLQSARRRMVLYM